MSNVLDNKKYLPGKTNEWTDQIANRIIERMKEIAPFFKYIVNVCFVQKVGAGLYCETIAHWDAKCDGLIQTKYENDSLICLVTVIGVAI